MTKMGDVTFCYFVFLLPLLTSSFDLTLNFIFILTFICKQTSPLIGPKFKKHGDREGGGEREGEVIQLMTETTSSQGNQISAAPCFRFFYFFICWSLRMGCNYQDSGSDIWAVGRILLMPDHMTLPCFIVSNVMHGTWILPTSIFHKY